MPSGNNGKHCFGKVVRTEVKLESQWDVRKWFNFTRSILPIEMASMNASLFIHSQVSLSSWSGPMVYSLCLFSVTLEILTSHIVPKVPYQILPFFIWNPGKIIFSTLTSRLFEVNRENYFTIQVDPLKVYVFSKNWVINTTQNLFTYY